MDPEKEVNVFRYLKFVTVFLIIIFGALGAYQYYYGTEARKAQDLQEEFNRNNFYGISVTVTSSTP